MKVSDDMVKAALETFFKADKQTGFYASEKRAMRCALEVSMKVYAMEQLVEAGAEQMEQEATE